MNGLGSSWGARNRCRLTLSEVETSAPLRTYRHTTLPRTSYGLGNMNSSPAVSLFDVAVMVTARNGKVVKIIVINCQRM
jgi:hypothetical protein